MELKQEVHLSCLQVSELLKQFIEAFPTLSERIDIEQYSIKLSNNALFILACEDDEIVAFIAYYKDYDKRMKYIPLIAVKESYRGKGIGGAMLTKLFVLDDHFTCIRLEVFKTNKKAYQFYANHGFSIIEDRNDRFLLEKTIL